MSQLRIRTVAVLGAGVMGAQIAAHLANADVDTVLFDLPAKEGDRTASCSRRSPTWPSSALPRWPARPAPRRSSRPTTRPDLEQLQDCDLIIEAIAERMDWKQDLYAKIAPFVADHAVLASNTSGLAINKLGRRACPKQLRHRFCGVHFFNPPRYMHLAELIPAPATDAAVLEGLEAFLVTTLGKGVVYAKDTPNFIGNRIGVFSILSTIHHTAAFGLGFDEVDALTGPLIGRPKSATYRTSDVVGLDTMAHVIKTMADTLPDDPWHEYFKSPEWLEALIAKGALGQKTGAGIFRKVGKDIVVLDLAKQDYRPADRDAAPEVVEILKIKNPAEKFAKLRASQHPQAQFLWAIFRDLFHYSAYHLADIADTARDVDLAIRWGYGWSLGPFETWQAAGWKQVAQWIAEDIVGRQEHEQRAAAGLGVRRPRRRARRRGQLQPGAQRQAAALDAARSTSASASRIRCSAKRFAPGETVFENDGVRMWHDGDDIAVRQLQDQDEHRHRRRARRPAGSDRASPSRTSRAW